MKHKWKIVALAIAVSLIGGYVLITYLPLGHESHREEQKQLYTCPMHPQIVQDAPGECPICGMKLVPLKKEEKHREKKTMYRSTMNPNEVSDKPGKDSMGMEMIPFEAGGEDDEIVTPSGLAPVTITREKREMIGLSLEEVKVRPIRKEIRTSVRIVPDETRQYRVMTKVSGWVEKLYVNQTGQFVKKGAPLLSIYSPELLSAQQEYLSALRAGQKFRDGRDADMSDTMNEIGTAARERLRLLDISDYQIDRIRSTGKIERAATLYAPSSGYVTEKTVLQGQKIMVNDALMEIVDLSVIWGELDIHESDLPYVKTGMPVEVTLSYWEGKTFRGRISFFNPFMDPDTRVLKARVVIPNGGLVLKPNMYGDAKLSYNVGRKLAVCDQAVMRTGVHNYVFIAGKGDLIVPYEVKLGVRSSDGYYEVISGLKGGERVVTSANFLVDSESSLRAAFKEASGAHTH
ncbi:MAG: efflux RND transporter periplasmic adaptor subunit [Spirochaetes bacterium]|nr:efflux RND transporter periplasmic adaptor subunit [Spirochaetota bacterium]